MAYDHRKNAVLAALEATEEVAVENKPAVRRTVEGYFTKREGRLDNLLEALRPSSEASTRTFRDRAQQAYAEAVALPSGIEHGALWLANVSLQEMRFWAAIRESELPEKRDEMVRQTSLLGVAEEEFDEKWAEIRQANQQVEEDLQEVADEYTKILQDAVTEATELEKETKEKAADAVSRWAGRIVSFEPSVLQMLVRGGTALLKRAVSEVEGRAYTVYAMMSRKEAIIVSFQEAREIVKEFLEETNYDLIKEAFTEAEQLADRIEPEGDAEGQAADLTAFATHAKTALAKVFGVAEEAYKAFATKHETLFFGPLGGDYYQELQAGDVWKAHSRKWQESKHDLHDLLRERWLTADRDKIFDVSITGLTDQDRDALPRALQSDLRELLAAWNKFKASKTVDDPNWALESRESFQDMLDRFR